jgi:hypothetical protein
MCVHWRTENIGILRGNRCTLGNSYWFLLWKAFTISSMSADQYKQIGILRGATPFNIRTGFIKQNDNFTISQYHYKAAQKSSNTNSDS